MLRVNNFDKELIIKCVPLSKQKEALKKLAEGYPVQYIIGNVEFYNTTIDVNEDVLIPRFETEYLVDDLIKYIKEYKFNNSNIIDIGTGSGCIAIALKKALECNVTALDISEKALGLAKKNAEKNNADIEFLNEDVNNLRLNAKFDILVSNPPYVPFDSVVDKKTKFEPQNAIFAEENGLYFYRIILQKSKEFLNNKNIIAFEIGNGQAAEISDIARKYYPMATIVSKKDLNNFDRYIYIIND